MNKSVMFLNQEELETMGKIYDFYNSFDGVLWDKAKTSEEKLETLVELYYGKSKDGTMTAMEFIEMLDVKNNSTSEFLSTPCTP